MKTRRKAGTATRKAVSKAKKAVRKVARKAVTAARAGKAAKAAKKKLGPPVPLDVLRERLAGLYPEAYCELNHTNAFELLIATILSAQCTDERVNKTTPEL